MQTAPHRTTPDRGAGSRHLLLPQAPPIAVLYRAGPGSRAGAGLQMRQQQARARAASQRSCRRAALAFAVIRLGLQLRAVCLSRVPAAAGRAGGQVGGAVRGKGRAEPRVLPCAASCGRRPGPGSRPSGAVGQRPPTQRPRTCAGSGCRAAWPRRFFPGPRWQLPLAPPAPAPPPGSAAC